jgi:NAD(P)-dependent dehydrogenase (short-subunit alcohol dehydrogenase family)
MDEDPTRRFRLDGRVALVTGASSGIGVLLAETLAGAGARVVVAARRQDRIQELAQRLPGAVAIRADMDSDADIRRLVDEALVACGRLDVLVNNAGITEVVSAEDEDIESFRRLLNLNLAAPFLLTQLVARHMLANVGGSVINVASVLGLRGVGQIPQAGYAASKGGMVNLTRELAAQWARRGIRVNAIAPAWFPTEMTDDMFSAESGQRWIRRRTPMGRPGELEELGGALLFLASPASAYVTGQILAVDGGWTAV